MKILTRHPFTAALVFSLLLHTGLAALIYPLPDRIPVRHSQSSCITFNFKQAILQKKSAVPPKNNKHVEQKKMQQQKKPYKKTPAVTPKSKALPSKQVTQPQPVPNPDVKMAKTKPAESTQQNTQPASAPDSRALLERKRIIDDFLSRILFRIEQAKRYPRAARRRGITETITCRFVITRDGSVQKTEVLNAVQHSVLKKAALETIKNAAPYPQFPSFLEEDTFSSVVDIVFEIEPKI